MLDHQNKEFHDQAEELAEAHVAAWGRSRILQESKKPYIARLSLQFEEQAAKRGEKLSVAAAERMAIASDEYREFFKGMVEAEREEKRTLLAYKNHENRWMKT